MASVIARNPARRRVGNSYYTTLAAIMLALGLVAFSDNLVTDVGQASNQKPSMVIHGLFALAWMILLLFQANLVRNGELSAHRRLGPFIFAIGAGLVLSTSYLFFAGFEGFSEMTPPVMANRIMLPLFAGAIFLAWYRRNLSAWHKRLIALGTVLTLSPILSRAVDRILAWVIPDRSEGIVDPLFMLVFAGVWTALVASQWIYDYKTIGRIHRVTIAATIVLYGVYALVYSL